MTRGFAEMPRLAVAWARGAETLAGLSGLGDLSLTCNSRSRATSRSAARWAPAGPAPGVTVEGVATARPPAARRAARGDCPIAEAVADGARRELDVAEAMDALLAAAARGGVDAPRSGR